jgi:hypothetical protein
LQNNGPRQVQVGWLLGQGRLVNGGYNNYKPWPN